MSPLILPVNPIVDNPLHNRIVSQTKSTKDHNRILMPYSYVYAYSEVTLELLQETPSQAAQGSSDLSQLCGVPLH